MTPRGLMSLVPLFCRSCRNPDRNDCKAAVDWVAAPVVPLLAVALLLVVAVPPPKAPINVLNAELRFDRTFDERPDVDVLSLSSWLLPKSLTNACNAAMMPPCSYCPAALVDAVPAAVVGVTGTVVGVAVLPAAAVAVAAAVPVAAAATVAAALAAAFALLVVEVVAGAVAAPVVGLDADSAPRCPPP